MSVNAVAQGDGDEIGRRIIVNDVVKHEAATAGMNRPGVLHSAIGIAASTDYAVFVFGRYQEARSRGEDRDKAYFPALLRGRDGEFRIHQNRRRCAVFGLGNGRDVEVVDR
ncbi:MmpS family transport accessory protein, partial [Mycobacterium sp. Lab-001]|uniref:MmpS family transport accessory protein n=1 Tax=Mycobacterium sp. Lab-001 TaxID=3410136 RepID=UPI003D17FBA5